MSTGRNQPTSLLWRHRLPRIAGVVIMLSLVMMMTISMFFHHWTALDSVVPIAIPDDVELKEGDLILAGGVSLESRAVMHVSPLRKYAHIGMLDQIDGKWYVLHASPDQFREDGVTPIVGYMELDYFLSTQGYHSIRILRLSDQVQGRDVMVSQAMDEAREYAERQVLYDPAYDLSSQKTLYCSEMIWLVFKNAGYQWPEQMTSDIRTIFVTGHIILPERFALIDDFEKVWEFSDVGEDHIEIRDLVGNLK